MFGIQEIDLGAAVQSLAWGDFDGDNDDDLIIVTLTVKKQKYIRRLHCYLNNGKAGFSKGAEPFAVPDNSCCFAIADLDTSKGDEIILSVGFEIMSKTAIPINTAIEIFKFKNITEKIIIRIGAKPIKIYL